ncbi:Ger(x)C family spore germination C-terminal domain-containing protein [Lysinibacillus fusiformis]|uniref:Ger(x)C family spore germination C-terminal domain-containing protein n=1 Tax=Lysinibacillus fusiformis TaxID=28031 RepID=UPI003D0255C9
MLCLTLSYALEKQGTKYCTQDSIEDIMLVSSILDKSPATTKLNDPQDTWKQESFIKPINLRNFVIGFNEPSHEVIIPLVSINKNWEIPNEQTEETTFTGFGVLSRDSFKGYINGKTARGIMWMNDETKQGEITIPLDKNEHNLLTVDIKNLNIDVRPVNNNNQVRFEVFLKFDTFLNGFKGKVSQDEVRKKVAVEIKKEILATFEEVLKMDTDIYRLSEILYRDNVKLWKKLEQNGKIPLNTDSISKVNVQINKVSPGRKEYDPITE